ncbi:MAG: hypothetical protein HYX68_16745 [Planctomycetes bacterium]|nr:hypothetical protein [Planctomycetota bacterium]
MNPTEIRVRSALEKTGSSSLSAWPALMALYRSDREAFYLLACDGVNDEADANLRALADLANRIRFVVRSTYQIEPGGSTSEACLLSRSGDNLSLPAQMVPDIKRFLLEVDGKGVSTVQGKDFVGTPISEAEARFKLGDRSTWDADRQRLQARRSAEPLVLRVDPQDLKSLESLPAYVRHGLLNCATKTVLAPTVVFEGLNRGEGSPERLRNGLIFCGKPRRTYDGGGQSHPAPTDMVYVVYVDQEGFVFDWDWVKENPGEPGYPIDWPLRFGNPVNLSREAALEVPANVTAGVFDQNKAAYSERGDCVFCYICDEPAFAHRYNSDLTVFRQFGSETITGFKVKNVRRICLDDKSINLGCLDDQRIGPDAAPELDIAVDAILMASLKGHRDMPVDIYTIIIRALFRDNRQPPKVTVPKNVRKPGPQLTTA